MEKSTATAPVELFNWTGFYIGGNLGGMLSNYEFNGSESDRSSSIGVDAADQLYETIPIFQGIQSGMTTFFSPHHGDSDGAPIGGGQIGYQYQFGHFVLGLEGSFDRTSTAATNVFRDTRSNFFFGTNQVAEAFTATTTLSSVRRVETNWNGAVTGKVGFAEGPFLFYALGGVTWTDVNVWANDIAATDFFATSGGTGPGQILISPGRFVGTVANTNISRDDQVRSGWTAGAGVDLALSDLVSLGLQYRHNDFSDDTSHFSSHGGPIFPGSTNVSVDSDQVTLRFNVLLSHLFGSQHYAGTNENMSIGYTAARDAKDKSVAVPPTEPFSWTGFYFGGNVGGYWADYDYDSFNSVVDLGTQFDQVRFNAAPPVADASVQIISSSSLLSFRTPGFNDNGDGGSDGSVTGGGQIGFNYQFGHFLVGFEGDFGSASTTTSTRFSSTEIANFIDNNSFSADTTFTTMRSASTNWNGSARLRLGWAHDRLLLYATGGGVWTDITTRENDIASTNFFFGPVGDQFIQNVTTHRRAEDNNIQGGWTAGGGAEWAITRIASLGLDYRHNWLGDENHVFTGQHSSAISGGTTNIGIDSDQVTLRVNFLLGNVHGP